MKCPWLITEKQYTYSIIWGDDNNEQPVDVKTQEFSECIGIECPFFGNKDQMKDICYRTFKR